MNCEVRIFAPRMKQLLAILFVSFALAAVGVLRCLPHHHHGDKVCFAVEQTTDHHEGECCDHHHAPETPTTEDRECCSLVDMLQHQLASSEVRCDVPCWEEVALPAWCEVLCEECEELSDDGCGAHCFVPPLYESPLLGIRALRAPPIA